MNQEEIVTKKCSNPNCDQPIKPISEFSKNKNTKDGFQCLCKLCTKKYKKLYNIINKEKIKNKRKIYRNNNINKMREKDKKYYWNNREKCIECSKNYRKTHPNHMKQYRELNAEKIKKDQKTLKTFKYNNDINFKIKEIYRSRVRLALKNDQKCGTTLDLLGCTIDELKSHLEKQFTEGMNWENYGQFGWHIDHIIPCSVFDLSDPIEQKQCFHYTNLQPLWWKDNLEKGTKINY